MHSPLLAAVLAAPEDDAPRLAYADAIEPRDPALARHIRFELQRARAFRGGHLGASTWRDGARLDDRPEGGVAAPSLADLVEEASRRRSCPRG